VRPVSVESKTFQLSVHVEPSQKTSRIETSFAKSIYIRVYELTIDNSPAKINERTIRFTHFFRDNNVIIDTRLLLSTEQNTTESSRRF